MEKGVTEPLRAGSRAATFGLGWNAAHFRSSRDPVRFRVMFASPLHLERQLLAVVLLVCFGVDVSRKPQALISQINGILGLLSPF